MIWSAVCFLAGFVFSMNTVIRKLEPLLKDEDCDKEEKDKEKNNYREKEAGEEYIDISEIG